MNGYRLEPGEERYLDSCRWFVDLHEEERVRVIALLAEKPFMYHFNRVQIRIAPMGGPSADGQTGAEITAERLIPTQGGVELLRYHLDRMVQDLITAKSKSLISDAEQL